MAEIVGGILQLLVNGERQLCMGDFEYSLGGERLEVVVGADGVHGYKVTHLAPFIRGTITDRRDLNVRALRDVRAAGVVLQLQNGKDMVLRNAAFTGEGVGSSEEGGLQAEWTGLSAEEVVRSA